MTTHAPRKDGTADASGDVTDTPVSIRTYSRHDPDATWSGKTAKSGQTEWFFGYFEHTLVLVSHGKNGPSVPNLIARTELTTANADVVEPTLDLLDRLPRPATDIIGDRHYSFKTPERWRDPLARAGTRMHLDLRSDEHGFVDVDGTLWAAGWPHCPGTPPALGTILRPAPYDSRQPGAVEHDTAMADFRETIAERQTYALRRVTSPDPTGKARWQCPALEGKVGCPLRAGTETAAVEAGLPIVQNAPSPDDPALPKCCTQTSVTLDPGPYRKLMQPHYWGSPAWESEYNKRPYVESSYGSRKNLNTEAVQRGFVRVDGIARLNLALALSALSYNLRTLRRWYERTGETQLPADHPLHTSPLVQPSPSFDEVFSHVPVNREEATRMAREHQKGAEPSTRTVSCAEPRHLGR